MPAPAKSVVIESPSLLPWALLAALAVIGSYVLSVVLAVLCFVVPWWLMSRTFVAIWGFGLMLFGIPAGITILWSLVQSAGKIKRPGIPLDMVQQPRLKAEIESVATALGEPLPDEVYLIRLPNAFVSERGGLFQKTKVRALGIGLPLVATLNVSQLRAVLAHEFAHFYTGDTRLTPWLYSSRGSMARILINLNTGRVSRLLKRLAARVGIVRIAHLIVFGSLHRYWRLLLHATNLLSRRQEYRSDELACRVGGTTAFTEALKTIRFVTATYHPFWNVAVAPLLNNGLRPPLVNGFKQFLSSPDVKKQADAIVEGDLKKLNDDPLDTHPPLGSRIRRASRIPHLVPNDNLEPATTLFDNLDSLEELLLAFMMPAIKVKDFRKMEWETAGSTIYIPMWQATVLQHVQLLGTYSIGQIPVLVQALKAGPPPLPDPQGMLLTRPQREERTHSILWMAMSLSLIHAGWTLHMQPGRTWISLRNDRLDVVALLAGIRSGRTSSDQWRTYCEKLGIAELPLTAGLAALSGGVPDT